MDSLWIVLAVIAAGLVIGALVAWRLRARSGSRTGSRTGARSDTPRPRPGIDYAPGVGDDDSIPRDTPRKSIAEVVLPADAEIEEAPSTDEAAIWEREIPEPVRGRLYRLRARLARSENAIGKGLLALLSRDSIDESTWDEMEEILLTSDLGVGPTHDLIERVRTRLRVDGAHVPVRDVLREELIALVDPAMDRSLHLATGRTSVVMMVGVNGTGKTTTTGKLARVLIAEDRTVVLAAADTFRAAAADQLLTWGDRVGAVVVRGPEGGDPASVAFEAVEIAQDADIDVVVVDTAGRLHTKTGLMDELGKVKRVIEKKSPVDEVLLVLDATTGQNGLAQAKVFSEVVDITGIVLSKLDGTAKGGIVIAVQRELGVPVKLVGLGEGPDDLAPFEPDVFVDALLGE